MRPYPLTTPSPGTICSSIPKSRQRCVTSLSSSSKEPSSSSSSTRSRAESLPSLCCRSRRSDPPPASAASCRRRNSSSLLIGTTVAHCLEGAWGAPSAPRYEEVWYNRRHDQEQHSYRPVRV